MSVLSNGDDVVSNSKVFDGVVLFLLIFFSISSLFSTFALFL